MFGVFAALAEFERELIPGRTHAGLAAARVTGRKGGRKPVPTKAPVRLALLAMKNCDTSVTELAAKPGIRLVALQRYVGPNRKAGETRRTRVAMKRMDHLAC